MKCLETAFLSLLAAGSVALTTHAQSALPLFSFDASGTNGASPEASLTLGPDGSFYGTTEGGGPMGDGTVFRITTNGTLTTLVNFVGVNGANPLAALVLGPDGNFYGTTEYGGNTSLNAGLGGGTVFRLSTNGALTSLVAFSGANGSSPHAALTLGPDGNFYGATAGGGPNGLTYGTLFRMTTNGTLTTLTNFNSANGSDPVASLTLGPDGNFYGTTESGGPAGSGTVFQLTTNGLLTTIFDFGTNNGDGPETSLVLGPDGDFYGTTSSSGVAPYTVFPGFTINLPSGNGLVYRISTNGTQSVVADFDNYSAGVTPNGNLLLGPDANFYGTTYTGGSSNLGTVYEVTTNGVLTTLVSFNSTNGSYPLAGLTLGADTNFYGDAVAGGTGGNGTVFVLSLPPPFTGPLPTLSVTNSGGGAFTLSATSAPNSVNDVWASTNLTLPDWQVIGTITTDSNGMGQFVDTNTAGIPVKFYQLSYP